MYVAMAVSPVVFVPEPGVEESIWTSVWVRETTSSIVISGVWDMVDEVSVLLYYLWLGGGLYSGWSITHSSLVRLYSSNNTY